MSQNLPACDLDPPLQAYDCNNTYPDCLNPYGFQFSSLWTITNYVAACPTDTRLFDSIAPSLTLGACLAFVGSDSFTPYSLSDLYMRIATWKFPLIQLVTLFPRPPLSFGTSALVIAHLLGDPIGLLKSLLLKIACGQSSAKYWISRFNNELRTLTREENKRESMTRAQAWKALALIVGSYDEWGFEKGQEVQEFLNEKLTLEAISDRKSELLRICRKTARLLAGDRSTTSLPSSTALIIFMSSIAIAFARTPSAAEGSNPSTYINIEAHSIAFTAMYFWLIPAVILGCLVGMSNTKDSIPDILLDFEQAIDHCFIELETDSQDDQDQVANRMRWRLFDPVGRDDQDDHDENETFIGPDTRNYCGVYSCIPEDVRRDLIQRLKFRSKTKSPSQPRKDAAYFSQALHFLDLAPGSLTFSILLFLTSQATGLLISALIPPKGFWCRDWLEFLMTGIWLFSTLLNHLPTYLRLTSAHHHRLIFYFVLVKDTLLAAVNLGIVIAVQVGMLNRCSCYSKDDTTGLAFPEVNAVEGTLVYGIEVTYPAVAFVGIVFELLILPGFVIWKYKEAFSVFLQRNDGKSNKRLFRVRSGRA